MTSKRVVFSSALNMVGTGCHRWGWPSGSQVVFICSPENRDTNNRDNQQNMDKNTRTESVDLETIEHITCIRDFGCFILFVVLCFFVDRFLGVQRRMNDTNN